MASFRGAFTHTIDEKGRFALPKPFRRITGVKTKGGEEPILVVTKGFNGCVALYTEDEWPRYERQLRDELFTDQDKRNFVLELAEVTSDSPIDTVGRVLLSGAHLEMGGLDKNCDVLVLGVFDHIELWNPGRYREHFAKTQGTFEERAKHFFNGSS